MAIQFHCPSCQAMIRVPDAAAGKKGTCPRCNEKLLVPDVVPASPSAPARPGKVELPSRNPTAVSGLPKLDPLADSPLPDITAQPAANVPFTPAEPPLGLAPLDAASAPGRSKKFNAKKPSGRGAWVAPVLCILGVAGFLAWYTWKSQPRLEGALVAHVVPILEVEPGKIPGDLSGLKPDDLDGVLRRLSAQPVTWASTISKFTMRAVTDGVEVTVHHGSAAHFVSVAPRQNAVLVDYIKQHSTELDEARLAALKKYAPALFAAWKRQFDKNDPIDDQKKFRDLVLIPALVSGLGYHLEASVNGNVYPCVYEDSDRTLYFLLPNATKSFQIKGRSVAGGVPVPANFTVTLSTSGKSSPSRKKSKAKTAAEREAENQGMNPDLLEPENDESAPAEGAARLSTPANMPSDEPQPSPTKSKASSKQKPVMTENDEMSDEMPAKSRPKKKTKRSN